MSGTHTEILTSFHPHKVDEVYQFCISEGQILWDSLHWEIQTYYYDELSENTGLS